MGSALLVVIILGGIICLFVMYYLSLIQQQNTLSVRSQAWNIAIAVTEAGIEEGMQALNSDLNLSTSDGWYPDGTGMYCRTNQDAALGGNWYTIAIRKDYPIAFQHEVTCRAYVTLPALALNTPSVFFAAYGVNLGPGVISRAVRVKLPRQSIVSRGHGRQTQDRLKRQWGPDRQLRFGESLEELFRTVRRDQVHPRRQR